MNTDEEFADLAKAIADGVPVDWQEGTLPFDHAHQVLENLEIIEAMAQLSKTDEGDTIQPLLSPGPDSEAMFQWGHLDVMAKIGQGGYGEVYRAWDRVLQREVALKLCRTDRVYITGQRPYLEEARRLARVRHPNVLAVYGADTHNDRIGLWCDLIRGQTLASIVDRFGPMKYQDILPLAKQAIDALIAVHQSNLVHGDIKLANMMMQQDEKLVLMDFGAVIDLSQPSKPDSVIGTPMYMAPEVINGMHPTASADVYALGVALYRLSSGNYPFDAQSLPSMAHQKGKGQSVVTSIPGYPPAWRGLLEGCLQPEPEARLTAKQVRQALVAMENEPARRKRRRFLTAAFLSVSVIAVAFALLSLRLSREVKRANFEAETAESLVGFVVGMFNAALPINDLGRQISARDVVDQAILQQKYQTDMTPMVRARMKSILGTAVRQMGDTVAAEKLVREAMTEAREAYGPTHPVTLATESELMYVLHAQSKYQEAIAVGRSLLERTESVPGMSHVEVLSDLAGVYAAMGDTKHAGMLFDEAKVHLDELVKSDPEEAALLMLGIGRFYTQEGRFAEADQAFERSSGLLDLKIGNVHPHRALLAEAQMNLAEHRGDLNAARVFGEKALNINLEVFPKDHPNIAASYTGLGRVAVAMGRLQAAGVYFESALAIHERIMPEDSPNLARTRLNYALFCLEIALPQKARNLLEKVLPVMIDNYGEDSPLTASALLGLGNAYLELGQMASAMDQYQRALQILDSNEANAATTALVWNNMGEIHTKNRDFESAAHCFDMALKRTADMLGAKHPQFAAILFYRVDMYLEQADATRAQADLVEAEKILSARTPGGWTMYEFSPMNW